MADTSKFKNCFIDQRPDYYYDILIEGEKFATAKTLSARDQSKVSKLNKMILLDGQLVADPNNDSLETLIAMIQTALVSWVADRELNADNISMLPLDWLTKIAEQINAHQGYNEAAVEDTEKN